MGKDSCYYLGSPILDTTTVTGGDWTVADDNTWSPDYVGWYPNAVNQYRNTGRAPCGFFVYQQMAIQCGLPTDSGFHNYGRVNVLKATITATEVTSDRADSPPQTKVWP
jgi:hypothetical protein